jgi:glycosyltransferase involved in cell wall biosynthesis
MNADRGVLVVPCFNEERRLDAAAFATFARSGSRGLLFVNDGSTDHTGDVLRDLERTAAGHIEVLTLERNAGKAEAVRRGLQHALFQGAGVLGYLDADLSTPLSEISRLVELAETGSARVVFGSRVAMMGSRIERGAMRHYLGRVFATAASLVLGIPVYDTQCGAKCFRASGTLRAALSEPFLSSWAFDVELLGRLLVGTSEYPALDVEDFVEVPLRRWRDVGGSKLGAPAMLGAALDLLRIRRDLAKRRLATKADRSSPANPAVSA